ncbi:MAG: hypothetical protein ACREHF_09575 [Rhizomicrobium sp.]
MRTLQNAVLAGAAAVLLCGAFSVAAANDRASHVMSFRLPGGAVELIRYTGDVAPKVVIDPKSVHFAFDWPVAFGDRGPFAALDRISAEIDRQTTQMMRQANALVPLPDAQRLTEIASGKLPAGSEGYSFVSTTGGNVFCARSVQITSRGKARKPRVVSRTYGNCAGAGASVGSGARSGAEPADRQDRARSIDYVEPSSGGMLHEASAVQ